MSDIVGKMTKKLRESIFNEEMNKGYQLYVDGYLDVLEWQKWSWNCYRFKDEEIDENKLMETLNGIGDSALAARRDLG